MTDRSKDQDLIDELAAWMQAPDTTAVQTNGHARVQGPTVLSSVPTDEMVIQKCRGAENAAKFADLFDHGDVHAHHGGDNSAADLALLGIMSFYTQNKAQLERIFSSSALGQRVKWRHRGDYRRRTISRALANLGETYDWSKDRGGTAARPLKKGVADAVSGSGPADFPYRGGSTKSASDAARPKLSLVRFAERDVPGPASSSSQISYPATIPRRSTVGAARRRA